MLKEEIRQKLFGEVANKGNNLEESLQILSEALLDYEVTKKWIFIYLLMFTKMYYDINENSIIAINECIYCIERDFEEKLFQNDKKYSHEDAYIEDMYESIKKDVDDLIHPKMKIDNSSIYSNICNHRSNPIGGLMKCSICGPINSVIKTPMILVAKKSKSLPIEVDLDRLAKHINISSFIIEELIDFMLDNELSSTEWMKVPVSCIKKYNLHKKYDYYIKVIEL